MDKDEIKGSVFIEARDRAILRAREQWEAVERLSMIEDGRGVMKTLQQGMIYLIGSLRNPNIPIIANRLREEGWEVFDDWYASGPEADKYWREYELGRGRLLPEALKGHVANHVYGFDIDHLHQADAVVLVMPAGKSAHMELGYARGRGQAGYVLLEDDPDRYDFMYKMATGLFFSLDELIKKLKR